MYICELSKGKDKEKEARYNLAVYVRHKYSKYGKATKEISTNRRTDQGRQLQAIIGRWVVGKKPSLLKRGLSSVVSRGHPR